MEEEEESLSVNAVKMTAITSDQNSVVARCSSLYLEGLIRLGARAMAFLILKGQEC